MKDRFLILFVLVKRDYAIQFAGSALGIFWAFIQSIFYIFIYLFVIYFFNKNLNFKNISFLFSGLLFWLPLQEMLVRSTSILSENRNLIKKSNLGMNLFLQIPFCQMLIHFFILSIPVFLILKYFNSLSNLFFLSYIWIFFVGLNIYFLSNFLSKANVLLKDITPIIRLFSQILFWTLPILINLNSEIFQYHPFFSFLKIFRILVLKEELISISMISFIYPVLFFYLIYFLSEKKLSKLILDHL